jgi:hypothetical protein
MRGFMYKIGIFAWAIFVWPLFSTNTTAPSGVPVRVVVTLGHHYGQAPPVLTRDDLIVRQQVDPLPITNLAPLRGDQAGLELFLLVDNCSNCEPGSKFEELRRFISSQPSTTLVGIAYIAGGRLQVAEAPTADHDRAVKALNTPTGSKLANPYGALTELIQGWPPSSSRRAVLMISTGIDPAASDALEDPSAETALEAAERAGITLYAIYHPSADYLTSDLLKINSGQIQMSHLAYDTGGEAYFLSLGPLPSLAPFLSDIADHLRNQYLLEFLANPGAGGGELEQITVKSKLSDVELMAPDKVWIPGSTVTRKKRP